MLKPILHSSGAPQHIGKIQLRQRKLFWLSSEQSGIRHESVWYRNNGVALVQLSPFHVLLDRLLSRQLKQFACQTCHTCSIVLGADTWLVKRPFVVL
jgi:hypothetical protein